MGGSAVQVACGGDILNLYGASTRGEGVVGVHLFLWVIKVGWVIRVGGVGVWDGLGANV